MAKQSFQLHEFTVTGIGDISADMLRYDSCWPARQEDAAQIFSRHGDAYAKHTITLRGLRAPTVDRWLSFGWRVDNVRKVG